MDAVNQTLLLSLRQEVKSLNELVNKLPTAKNGEVVRSWLFPSKPYYFVHELVYSDKICESESFKTYLEIIIDRLYVGICLILNYVEEKIRKPEENRFIYRPKLTTLGYNFERLWEAVSVILSEEMSTHMVKETTTGEDNWTTKVFNKETQTNIISLNKCDSCASAMLCMKNLLQSFNKNQFKMPLNQRQLLRPKIYDITQFGCMLQTTSSIEKGLNRLYERLFSKEQERDLLYSENQQLKTQISEKCGRITFLHRETEMLKDKLEKDSLKITILNTQFEELSQIKNKQDCHIKILNENVGNLNKSMKAYNETMSKLVSEKAKLSFLYKGIMNNQLHVITFSTLLETRLTAIEDKHADIKNSFKLLDEMMDIVNKRLNKVNNVLTAVDIKINNINYLEDISLLESKLQQLKQIRHGQEETTNVWTNLQRNSFQIKGNPVEDLTRQMEENNISIKKLENENIKLKCIISKLTSLKK